MFANCQEVPVIGEAIRQIVKDIVEGETMSDEDGREQNETKAFPLPPEDPDLFKRQEEFAADADESLRSLEAAAEKARVDGPPEEIMKAFYDSRDERTREQGSTKLPALNRFMFADTTLYFKTLAAYTAAQTRFLRLVNTPDKDAYYAALGDYSIAQGNMIGASQQLLHDLGVI
jgi:hypothetical protein